MPRLVELRLDIGVVERVRSIGGRLLGVDDPVALAGQLQHPSPIERQPLQAAGAVRHERVVGLCLWIDRRGGWGRWRPGRARVCTGGLGDGTAPAGAGGLVALRARRIRSILGRLQEIVVSEQLQYLLSACPTSRRARAEAPSEPALMRVCVSTLGAEPRGRGRR